MAKNTVLFIYGDHEALPDDEWKRAASFAVDSVGLRLDEQCRRRVPLFVINPGVGLTGIVERVSGQIDLAPTLLHLLGIPSGFFLGQNLFHDSPPLVYFRTGSFITENSFVSRSEAEPGGGACKSIIPGMPVDTNLCTRYADDVRQRIEIS